MQSINYARPLKCLKFNDLEKLLFKGLHKCKDFRHCYYELFLLQNNVVAFIKGGCKSEVQELFNKLTYWVDRHSPSSSMDLQWREPVMRRTGPHIFRLLAMLSSSPWL